MFSEFGTSALLSAFLLAFTLPNLFRQLLGEGALTSALIPLFSDEYEHSGKDQAFLLLNRILTRLMQVLLVLVIGGMSCFFIGHRWAMLSEQWRFCLLLSIVLFPYLFFICVAAVLSAILNVLGSFFLAACNSIWLNLSMITASLAGYFLEEGWRIYALCTGVLVGGAIQLGTLWWALQKKGWKFSWNKGGKEQLLAFRRLFLPGAVGASTAPLNTAISRSLAYTVSGSAVSALYLANRLVELPLGMFVIAITTVIFPRLSVYEAKGDQVSVAGSFHQGIFLILLIIVPATFGLLSLDRTILNLLFHWGNFTIKDVNLVLPVLRIFILSLPLYALATFLVRVYHSKKEMFLPMIFSIINLVVNVVLTLLLKGPLQEEGIALANLLAILLQTVLLQVILIHKYEMFRRAIFCKTTFKIVVSGALMGLLVILSDRWMAHFLEGKLHEIVSVVVNVPLGVVIYFVLVYGLIEKNRRRELLQNIKPLLKKFGL